MEKLDNEQKQRQMRRLVVALLTASVLAAIDLFAKWSIVNLVMNPPRVIPISPFFNLVLGFNRGVTFGLFDDLGTWGPIILSALALGIIGVLIVWLQRVQNRGELSGLILVIGGALGNLIDRLQDGAVTDYLDFYISHYHWPAFNLADSFIVVGFAGFIYFSRGVIRKEENAGQVGID